MISGKDTITARFASGTTYRVRTAMTADGNIRVMQNAMGSLTNFSRQKNA